MNIRNTVLTTIVLLALPGVAHAQSQWGLMGSFSPEWRTPPALAEKLGGASAEASGQDITIGFVRGRAQGGDWGFSFTRKRWDDGSGASDTELDCTTYANGCFAAGDAFSTRGVSVTGIEVHKYMPFVTIKRRAQIGLSIAGGVGWVSGQADRITAFPKHVATDPRTREQFATQVFEAEQVEAKDELFSILPIAKLHLVAAGIIGPHLKVKVQSGLNFPGTEMVSFSLVYLF